MDQLQKNKLNRELCPVGKALKELGDKWVLLLLRELFYGFRRFEEFQETLKISRSVLSTKLNKMLADGLIEKRLYHIENERPRHEYHLTRKGKDLFKIIIALSEWGNQHLVKAGEYTATFVDIESKKNVQLSYTDEAFVPIHPKNIRMKPLRK